MEKKWKRRQRRGGKGVKKRWKGGEEVRKGDGGGMEKGVTVH